MSLSHHNNLLVCVSIALMLTTNTISYLHIILSYIVCINYPYTVASVISEGEVTLFPSDANVTACVGEALNFTCITNGSSIAYWRSSEYIGDGGHRLEFARLLLPKMRNSTVDDSTFATLVDALEVNKTVVLKIELNFVVFVESIFFCGAQGTPGVEKSIHLIVG